MVYIYKILVICLEKKKAFIVNFKIDTSKFKTLGERNKFFRDLYGWKQVVTRKVTIQRNNRKQTQTKRYVYKRKGLLNDIPHIKIDDSVFIVDDVNIQQILDYFEQWNKEVDWEVRKIFLEGGSFYE